MGAKHGEDKGGQNVSPSLWKWPVIAPWGCGPVINQRRGAGTEAQALRLPTVTSSLHCPFFSPNDRKICSG